MIPHTIARLALTTPAHNPAAAPKHTAWPTAGTADVTATSAAAANAGGLPVLVGKPHSAAAAPRAVSSTVRVTMLDQATAHAAGVTGVVFTVAPTAPVPVGSAVSVGLDYRGFRDAVGGAWADRLRLVRLPACALTTPGDPACRTRQPIPTSADDGRAGVVSADVAFDAPVAHRAGTDMGAAQTTTDAVVLATDSTAAGSTGTYSATSLAPSASWAVSGSSGAFSWSYPITVPAAAAGTVTPKIALSYNSQSVDGRLAGTNNQVSWVGEGWDYSPGYIERTYRSCADDSTLPSASQTQDLCWSGQIVTMNLGGSAVALVQDDTTHAWHPAADDGSRVEQLFNAGNGAQGGEYWKVTTVDGTQYFFGRNSGPGHTNQATTNSTLTVPVYGAHPGDPCNNSAGFAASSCDQGWRWNLDYVEDPHGNVAVYYYTPETNYYGADGQTTGVAYTRGAYLNRIDYGLRDENGTIYASPAADQVLFTVTERCVPTATFSCDPSLFTSANATNWPDTPQDLQCTAGAACSVNGPSFWSTKRLTGITTQYYNGSGFTKVDSYALAQQFSSSGDPSLWLNSVTRTGFAADGSSLTMPPVSFTGQVLDNRVAGYNNEPPMSRLRLTQVTAETGAVTIVGYSAAECTATNVPADPSNDTMRCFPEYWELPYQTTPTLDYFHKYLATQVVAQDPNAISPSQVTDYAYLGAPAWHFDDNEVVKPANRTYGQFRGYGQVQTRTGNPGNSYNGVADQQTLTTTTYFRGMDGDTLPNGATGSVSLTDSLGESVPDSPAYRDTVREKQEFNGDGGAQIGTTITDRTTVATTATRARAGLPAQVALLTGVARSRSRTNLAAGGARTASTTYAYDAQGRQIQRTESGDNVPDVCTSTTYADNTSSWIRDRVAEVVTSQQVCPAPGIAPAPVLGDVRSYYDNQTTLGSLPGPGDATRTDTATTNTNGSLAFATATATFDASGRPLSTTDPLQHTTKTAYTPADGGNLTQRVTTNPLKQTTTVTTDPGRGTQTADVDVAGHRTDATYDQLGRLTAVWLPGHSKAANAPASRTYAYQSGAAGPEAVTTKTLVNLGTSSTYTTSINLYDALGQLVQTQADAQDGSGGRVGVDTFHDSHGWVVHTDNHYLTNGAPSTTLISVADSQVNDRTVNTYDGAGRVTLATEYNGLNPTWHTQTVHSGDSTTTIPPAGGVTTTAVTDTRGRIVEQREYTAPPTVSGSVVSGGAYQSMLYHFTPTGAQDQLTDADHNVWRFGYDLLGDKTSANDPDSGATTYTYDQAGELTSSTDARGQTLAYTYDALGRKNAEYSGSISGPKLASWVYDTVQAGKLSYSTRFTPQGNYLVGYGGYDGQGNPTSESVQVPSGEAGLAGTYTTQYQWDDPGQQAAMLPVGAGGLPGEWVSTAYNGFGKPASVNGYSSYLSAADYTAFGEPAQYSLGVNNNSAWLTYDMDPQTRRVTDVNLSAQIATPQLDDTTYTYDPAGNPTRSVDVQGPAGSPTQTQCYAYDALDRLSQAWTATDGCAGSPTAATIGGVDPYWTSWQFDPTGLRTAQTQHSFAGATGDTTTTYTYPATGAAGAHTLSSTSTTGPTGTSSTGYGYDAAGNTTTRTLPQGTQTLTWDAENHLAAQTEAAGNTSYVYDADGTELLRRDPSGTTLFLPDEELAYDNTSKTVTGTRYYAVNGQAVAVRVGGASAQYLAGDQHGTMQISYASGTGTLTRRAMDPYGNQLASVTSTVGGTTSAGSWPDSHGFLGKPADAATGLTDVGAREYDPSAGRFVSVDSVLDAGVAQQLNGYTYGGDNPLRNSDPSGQCYEDDGYGSCLPQPGTPDDTPAPPPDQGSDYGNPNPDPYIGSPWDGLQPAPAPDYSLLPVVMGPTKFDVVPRAEIKPQDDLPPVISLPTKIGSVSGCVSTGAALFVSFERETCVSVDSTGVTVNTSVSIGVGTGIGVHSDESLQFSEDKADKVDDGLSVTEETGFEGELPTPAPIGGEATMETEKSLGSSDVSHSAKLGSGLGLGEEIEPETGPVGRVAFKIGFNSGYLYTHRGLANGLASGTYDPDKRLSVR